MIVSRPVWTAVQKVLDGRRRRGVLWDYEFSEFFRCGLCGSPVVGATQVRKGKIYPYYRCTGTLGDDYRPKVCDLKSFRADKLEPVIWEHIRSIVRDPSGVIADLRRAAGDGGDELKRRISGLRARVQKCRSEEGTLVMQRTRRLIDQEMLEALIAPITNLRLQHEQEIELLLEQRALGESLDELEEHVRAMFDHYSNGLDSLDPEGRHRLLRLLDVRLTAGRGQVLVTGVLDPSLFTTGRTLALPRERSRRCRWV